jgi:Asp-tRNA(Asn)/Glu-tRNA(Gln) amidotransferase C subunit
MSLEVLSNIKDATSSESVDKLFGKVRAAVSGQNKVDFVELMMDSAVSLNDLRDDVVIESSESERQTIIDNFPVVKNNYLVVPKVIEE